MRTAKGSPSIRGRCWSKRWDAVGSAPRLRVVGGANTPGRPPDARSWTRADYGHPSCPYAVAGWPLEVRVWTAPPPAGVSAVPHPSGVWLAIRLLD